MTAPEGNDFALDNDGGAPRGNTNSDGSGGAPPANQNSTTHGLHADPDNLLEYLKESEPEATEWISAKYTSYLADAPFGPDSAKADQLKQVVVREYSIWVASGLQVREGVVKTQAVEIGDGEWIEAEREHAVNMPLDRMEKTVTRRLKELGVLGNDQPAHRKDGVEVMRSDDYVIEIDHGVDEQDEE